MPTAAIASPRAAAPPKAAGLALVGRHGVGRSAGVLDVAIALAVGKADVGGRHVVLQVDEGLAARGHLPQRLHGRVRLLDVGGAKAAAARKPAAVAAAMPAASPSRAADATPKQPRAPPAERWPGASPGTKPAIRSSQRIAVRDWLASWMAGP
jgi:hypothetical protein